MLLFEEGRGQNGAFNQHLWGGTGGVSQGEGGGQGGNSGVEAIAPTAPFGSLKLLFTSICLIVY